MPTKATVLFRVDYKYNYTVTVYYCIYFVTYTICGMDGEVVFDIFNGFKMGDISLKELTESKKR